MVLKWNNNTPTVRNVEIDFLFGSFFRQNITQYGDRRDVVRLKVTLPFAVNTKWFNILNYMKLPIKLFKNLKCM